MNLRNLKLVNYYGQTLVPCDAFVGIVIVTPWAPILLCSINGNQTDNLFGPVKNPGPN